MPPALRHAGASIILTCRHGRERLPVFIIPLQRGLKHWGCGQKLWPSNRYLSPDFYWFCHANNPLVSTAGEAPAILVLCSAYKLTLIGWKRARCKERAAKTGSIRPLEPLRRRRWPVSGQPAGEGQGSVGFVARRDSIHQYTFLASRPGPLGLPSKLIYRRYSALGYFSNMQTSDGGKVFTKYMAAPCPGYPRQGVSPRDRKRDIIK